MASKVGLDTPLVIISWKKSVHNFLSSNKAANQKTKNIQSNTHATKKYNPLGGGNNTVFACYQSH